VFIISQNNKTIIKSIHRNSFSIKLTSNGLNNWHNNNNFSNNMNKLNSNYLSNLAGKWVASKIIFGIITSIISRVMASKMQTLTLAWSKINISMILFPFSRTLWLWKLFWTKNMLGISRCERSLINYSSRRISSGSVSLEVMAIVSSAASSLSIFWLKWLIWLLLPISLKNYNRFCEPPLKYPSESPQVQKSFSEIKLT